MNTSRLPIYHAISNYIESDPTVFHMPGHKMGKGFPEELIRNLALWDLTEIPGTDNLHFPSGAIKEAQDLAAQAFGAQETYFLVNGSTCGIHAMIMAACKPGDKLIVARDCHKSVMGGMMLAGVDPVYLKPEFDAGFGIPTVISPGEVEKSLSAHPEAAGVLITRPTYYGICSDIEAIARIVHSRGKLLMVDEAHGAHLNFHGGLPVCAMQAGADICVQSAHKTLPAFTQGAYLHITGDRMDREKVRFYLRLLQTTSPSYVIMTFLDIARNIMQVHGQARLEELYQTIRWFGDEVKSNTKMELLTGEDCSYSHDWTRAVVNVKSGGITGFEAEKLLRKDYHIQVEMSDFYNIVCIGTVSDRREDYHKLFSALQELADKFKEVTVLSDIHISRTEIPVLKISPKEILDTKETLVKLECSAGRISRNVITPYPPGIPVVCPGEIITWEIVQYVDGILKAGGTVNGINENKQLSVVE